MSLKLLLQVVNWLVFIKSFQMPIQIATRKYLTFQVLKVSLTRFNYESKSPPMESILLPDGEGEKNS